MQFSKFPRVARHAGSVVVLSLFIAACSSKGGGDPSSNPVEPPAQPTPEQTTPTTSDGTVQNSPGNQPVDTVASDGTANIQLTGNIPDITSKLGEKHTFVLSVKAVGDFAGPVEVIATKDDLDTKYNAGADIKISVTPSLLTMAKNESMDVTVEVNVTPRAPDFKSPAMGGEGHFLVQAKTNINEQNVVATMDIPLQVDPVYEVRLYGPGSKKPHSYDRPTSSEVEQTEIRAHTGGVVLNFYNYDMTSTHVIHGDNEQIKHQNDKDPMAAATEAGKPGGSYSVTVTSTNKLKGNYYCHSHENPSHSHVILFNADK